MFKLFSATYTRVVDANAKVSCAQIQIRISAYSSLPHVKRKALLLFASHLELWLFELRCAYVVGTVVSSTILIGLNLLFDRCIVSKSYVVLK